MTRKKIVEFKATKTVQKPVTVSFKTKNGESVSFKAKKAVKVEVPVKFKAKK
ncbi:MAG: hypothetical protein R3B41_00350 [Candidatus Doudnabacteria bacterium]